MTVVALFGGAIARVMASGAVASSTMSPSVMVHADPNVVALVNGQAPDPGPKIANTCYSYVSADEAIHVASVHTWDDKDRTLKTVPGAGGVSSARSTLEGGYAWAWAVNVWQDSLG
jgi:hypothetical protein